MSTRANILIQDQRYGEKLWLYRHCDGYPEGAMPTLHELMKWVWMGRVVVDVGMCAGWLVLLGVKEYQIGMTPNDGVKPFTAGCGAYEPTTGRHGDIAFLYVIELSTKTLTCYSAYRPTDMEDPPDDVLPSDREAFVDSQENPWKPAKKEKATV